MTLPRDRDVDLVWALCCAIVEEYPGADVPVRRLIEVAAMMARGLTVRQRFQLSETLRDHADLLERVPLRVD